MNYVYFDTNIFTHIVDRIGASTSDVERLRASIAKEAVRICLSLDTLEETVCAIRTDPESTFSRLAFILAITDPRT